MNNWTKYKETMNEDQNQVYALASAGDVETLKSLGLGKTQIDLKNHKGYSLLMLAAYNGHQELVQHLLDLGADTNSVDAAGNSILMGVAFKGHTEIARLLLKYRASATYANPKNQTALAFAQMFGRTKTVKLLKSYQNQPETFGILDVIKAWSSIFNQPNLIKEESSNE